MSYSHIQNSSGLSYPKNNCKSSAPLYLHVHSLPTFHQKPKKGEFTGATLVFLVLFFVSGVLAFFFLVISSFLHSSFL